jgi:hypothetical protein
MEIPTAAADIEGSEVEAKLIADILFTDGSLASAGSRDWQIGRVRMAYVHRAFCCRVGVDGADDSPGPNATADLAGLRVTTASNESR